MSSERSEFDPLRYSDAKALEAAKELAEWVGDAMGDKSEWKCLRDDLADFIRKYGGTD